MSDQLIKLSKIYFAVGICEVIAECFGLVPVIVVLKPLIPVVLMGLYRLTSEKQSLLFYITMFFSFVTNIFFLPTSPDLLFFCTDCFHATPHFFAGLYS